MELPRTRDRVGLPHWGPARSRQRPRWAKKTPVRSCRPTGRLAPAPAALAYGALALAALESQARRGESMVLYADDTLLWRFALPRAGWWHTAPRARLPLRPLRPRQSKRDEARKRQAWLPYRPWSRMTSGVLRSGMGAVQSGTAQVFYNMVPHCEAQELRPYMHQGMATCSKTDHEGVMVVERSGIHRAPTLDATLDPSHGTCRCHGVPAHGGPHLNPMEGFWRVMKDTIGAGRCFGHLQQFSQRPHRVLMGHQAHPISAFPW